MEYQVTEYKSTAEGEHILTTHSYEEAIKEARRVIPLPGTESRIVTDGDGRKVAEYQAGDPPVTEVLTKGRLADAAIAVKARALRARLAILDGSNSAGMWSVAIYGDGEAAELIAYQGVTGAGKAKALWRKNRERYEAALAEWNGEAEAEQSIIIPCQSGVEVLMDASSPKAAELLWDQGAEQDACEPRTGPARVATAEEIANTPAKHDYRYEAALAAWGYA